MVDALFTFPKTPSPLLLHVAELAPPPIVPGKLATPLLQIVWLPPAFTVAGAFTATIAEACDEHPKIFVTFTVYVLLPTDGGIKEEGFCNDDVKPAGLDVHA